MARTGLASGLVFPDGKDVCTLLFLAPGSGFSDLGLLACPVEDPELVDGVEWVDGLEPSPRL